MPPKKSRGGPAAGKRLAAGKRRKPVQALWDNGLQEPLNQFSDDARDRLSVLHAETVSAVAGIREPMANLRLRADAISETVDDLMRTFGEEMEALSKMHISGPAATKIKTLTKVASLIQQMMKEILTFNVAEHDALRDLARSLMASVRHDISQTPPASFKSIRFMMEPLACVRDKFQSQSVRTAMRGNASVQSDTAAAADRVG